MAGFSTQNTENLIRTDVWSRQLKDVLLDELFATKYMDMITDFPDGSTLHLPSIGLLEARDYAEGQAIQYTQMDTGDWTFTLNKYKSVATAVSDKFKHDSFYQAELISRIVPNMHRALAKAMEVDFLVSGVNGQTSGDLNAGPGGASHRFIGSDTGNTIGIEDFAYARYALTKANVPLVNLTAIVDPSLEYHLATLTNLVNVSNNPSFDGVVRNGLSTGTRFLFNIFGWDVYISNNLSVNSGDETIDGTTVSNGVNNLFFSAASGVLPIKGLIRQPPRIEYERNKDLQQDEYVATCYYGYKLFRPENFITIVTDSTAVSV